MRAFACVAIFSAVVLAVSASPVENKSEKTKNGLPVVHNYKHGDKCPAEFFYNDCNYCFCIGGYSAGCTMMACLASSDRHVRSVAAPSIPHNDFFGITEHCVPEQQFIDKCNICKCNVAGDAAVCTRMACQEPEHPRIDDYTTGMKCPAGKTFNDRCNTCICSDDGHTAACTIMACPKEQ